MTRTRSSAAVALAVGILTFSWSDPGSAHRTVISNFTFHQDVRPILAEKCGRCHGNEGVAGLPLLKFEEARAASWSIRQALLADRMPPWSVVAGDTPFKGSPALTAREMNVLMTWAAGGTPAGTPRDTALPAPVPWPLGTPDLVLPLPPTAIDSGEVETSREVVLSPASLQGKWIALVDLRPQLPAVVRRAEIALRVAGKDRLIALWLPGEVPQRLEGGAAFRVPASAALVVRVHYRRPTPSDRARITDRSELGIYLSREASRRDVRAVELADPKSVAGGQAVTYDVPAGMTLVAFRPVSGPTEATATLAVITPDGSRSPLVRMTIRPGWPRRYVFAQPIRVVRGSRIEMRVTASQTALWESLLGNPMAAASGSVPLKLAIEVVD